MVSERKNKRFGWTPDLPDYRDYKYVPPRHLVDAVPSSTDLRAVMPPVYDQKDLGSCTAQAIAADIEAAMIKRGKENWTPSRLFIYFNERVIENTIREDSGAMLRDGIKSLVRWGFCKETTWPYDVSKFTKKPVVKAFREAVRNRITQYSRIAQNLDHMRSCLASNDPFFFGFTVFESFESDDVAKSGVMHVPAPHEKMLGGHAVLAVGYDDSRQCVIVRNSWGSEWGDKGYFYMPYSYITDPNMADDFWTVQIVP